MHGYHLHEAIDSHLGMGIQLAKPTAYRLLSNMTEDGWVTYREEQEGNRPPRRVYAVTKQGETKFQQLLRDSLANYQPAELTCQIGLAFIDALSTEEALALLDRRRSGLMDLIKSLRGHGEHPGSLQLMIDLQVHLLSAELDWLDSVIADLKKTEDREQVE
jgi:DNA-binding PadR family transcriptional regulator